MENSKLARDLKVMVGHPIYRKYKNVANKKLLLNCLTTTYDITNTNYMFESNLSGVRGETARNKPCRVDRE